MVHGSTNKIRKTDEEAISKTTFRTFESNEQKSAEAKFVGANASLWEEMSVKGDTNTILRKHTSFHSKICEICSPNMKGDTCEKQISFANPVILEPLILPEEQGHTVSVVGQLEEKLSENCGKDVSDKDKINLSIKN